MSGPRTYAALGSAEAVRAAPARPPYAELYRDAAAFIPVQRLIQDVMDDPVIPMHWGANQKGMQADKECDEDGR